MKRLAILLSVLLALSALTSGCGDSRDADLDAVDRAVINASAAQDSLAGVISEIESEAIAAESDSERLSKELALADKLMPVDLERALDHLYISMELARHSDSADTVKILIKIASLYNSQGMMIKEASEIFDGIDPSELPDSTKLAYFILGVQLNRNMADLAFDRRLKSSYLDKIAGYRDSVLSLDPQSSIIAVNKLLDGGEISRAENIMLGELYGMADRRNAAPAYHVLAQIYSQRNDVARQKHYLALAAVADLDGGVMEYKALSDLAMLLLADGDVARAYRYIHRSADDAAASHSYMRQMEIARVLPVIDAAYSDMKDSRARTLAVAGALLLVVVCVILVSFLAVRRKNRRLGSFASELGEANRRLKDAYDEQQLLNERIAEESRIKQTYITGFMEQCLSYLQKMERFRADLNKIAARRDLDALIKAIQSSRYVNREVAEFYSKFDAAFLDLYPDFIRNLNSLLKEEYRFGRSAAFSTELRIYALIRLGITGSGAIARFLRCSDSTVYNYRTSMRNKAIDRDNFEEAIMSL